MPMYQHILRRDRDLVSLKDRDQKLTGPNKELLIIREGGRVVVTALLECAPDAAYVSHLAKDPELPKGSGKILLKFAEFRARAVYNKQKMRVATVFHPECQQKPLENWYVEQDYQFFRDIAPTPDQRDDWEFPYGEKAFFKYFEKDLRA